MLAIATGWLNVSKSTRLVVKCTKIIFLEPTYSDNTAFMGAIDTDIHQEQDALQLRSVLQTKINSSIYSSLGMFLALFVLAFYFWGMSSTNLIVVWVAIIALGLLLRVGVMRVYSKKINSLDYPGLLKFKRALFFCSLILQTAVGAGVWFLGAEATPLMKLSMTAAICFYGVAILTTLSNDYHVYLYSSALLLIQPAIFWLFQGLQFYWVSVLIICAIVISLKIASAVSKNFAESIDIRFEQNTTMAKLTKARAETQLALEKAEKAIEDKAFFLASASHDLRQPLFAVNMINETLQLHDLSDSAIRLLKIQGQSIEAMNYMFNNLLDISHFDSQKVTTVLKDFDIHDLLLTMKEEFSTVALEKGLQIRFDIPNVIVHSDFDLVARVLRNLISNAIRYTASGKVIASADVVHKELLISVYDTGRGIAEADHERVFHEFVQLDAMPGEVKAGIGVGLAIVKHIDDLLGLRLEMKSDPSVGTTVSFYLPTAS
jgi:signal transduction histidine kinase